MRERELQKFLDAEWPGAWNVKRLKPDRGAFEAVRIDAVDLIAVPDLTNISLDARGLGFKVYATVTPKTEFMEDGWYFALWFMPEAVKARTPRKPDRRQALRRTSDKAARKLKRSKR